MTVTLCWGSVVALFVLIVGLVGIRFLSEWKQTVNTFVASLIAILTIAVAEATAIILTPSIFPLLVGLDVIVGIVVTVGIVVIWHRRFPKMDLEKAEHNALENMTKTKYQGVKIDRTKQSMLIGRTWYVYVNRNSSQGLATHVVEVDAITGEVKIGGLVPTYS